MPSLTVKTLDQKRKGYDPKLWEDYDDLYSGGAQIAKRACGDVGLVAHGRQRQHAAAARARILSTTFLSSSR